MPDLLLELFSEEIPARMQPRAAEDLKKLVTDRLVASGLVYEGAKAFFDQNDKANSWSESACRQAADKFSSDQATLETRRPEVQWAPSSDRFHTRSERLRSSACRP